MEAVIKREGPASLLALALPFILSRGGLALMGIVNLALVARIGASELAAVSLVEGSLGRCVDIATAFLVGALPYIAKSSRNTQETIALWQRLCLAALVLGLILIPVAYILPELYTKVGDFAAVSPVVAQYSQITSFGLIFGLLALATAVALETTGRANAVAVVILLANLLNAGLATLWIPKFGAVGGALTVLLVRIMLCLCLLYVWFNAMGKSLFAFAPLASAKARQLWHYCSTQAGSFAGQQLVGFGLTTMAAGFGAQALGAYSSAWAMLMPAMLVSFALADAIGFRASAAIDKKGEILPDLVKHGMVCGLMAGFYLCLGQPLSTLWMADPQRAQMLALLLPWSAFIMFLDGMSFGLMAGLRGLSDVRGPFVIQIVTMIATPFVAGGFAYGSLTPASQNVAGIMMGILSTSFVKLGLMAWRLRVKLPK